MKYYQWDNVRQKIKSHDFGATPWRWYPTRREAIKTRIKEIHARQTDYEIELKLLRKQLRRHKKPE